ncbi:hypothetical protein GTY75_03845 [Streptomyces sp. SID8381]|uniref:hypothetical protein n=1 Tax=unclassified Streptomyces TaxID=2593676 RepID=UPI00035F603F|nr:MULTISPECIES: hypothetical protein [unclassified Streptomyces]MYX25810.1 hypothetical protein [Streptomyces sp. SID8381]
MDDNDRRRLLQFSETPLVEHAVGTLRSCVPSEYKDGKLFLELGVDGTIHVGVLMPGDRPSPGRKAIKINQAQRTAFDFLLATAAYHRLLISQAWPNMERQSRKRTYAPDLPQYGRHAIGKVVDDLEQRLRIRVCNIEIPDLKAIIVSP